MARIETKRSTCENSPVDAGGQRPDVKRPHVQTPDEVSFLTKTSTRA